MITTNFRIKSNQLNLRVLMQLMMMIIRKTTKTFTQSECHLFLTQTSHSKMILAKKMIKLMNNWTEDFKENRLWSKSWKRGVHRHFIEFEIVASMIRINQAHLDIQLIMIKAIYYSKMIFQKITIKSKKMKRSIKKKTQQLT